LFKSIILSPLPVVVLSSVLLLTNIEDSVWSANSTTAPPGVTANQANGASIGKGNSSAYFPFLSYANSTYGIKIKYPENW
jgi:hypothetical protein